MILGRVSVQEGLIVLRGNHGHKTLHLLCRKGSYRFPLDLACVSLTVIPIALLEYHYGRDRVYSELLAQLLILDTVDGPHFEHTIHLLDESLVFILHLLGLLIVPLVE